MTRIPDLIFPTRPPFPRWAGWCGAALIALVVAAGIGFAVAGSGPLPLDTWWYGLVAAAPGSALHGIAGALALMGNSVGAGICFAVAVVALLILRRNFDAIVIAATGVLGVALSEVLKRSVQRARPPERLFAAHGYSFPSGHSMAAAALTVSLALVIIGAFGLEHWLARVALIAATVWVLAMMWSRTALHVHWLSDTIAGAALGVGVALLTRFLCDRVRARRGASALSVAPRTIEV